MKRMIRMKKMYMLIPALLLAAGAVLGRTGRWRFLEKLPTGA